MSEDIFGCHLVVTTVRRCYWSRMLLNILQCTEQPPDQKIPIVVHSAKVKKRYPRVRMPGFTSWYSYWYFRHVTPHSRPAT